nr:hypothetical protein [Amycolatopsis aidingensis]
MEQLLERAAELTLRAPELALILGERAAALAEASGSNELWVRAECLVVSARVRLGVRASTVGRAVAALRAAEDSGQVTMAAQLRTDLTVCARSVGAPLIGLAALRPALTAGGLHHARKAAALCHLVGCLGQLGRKPELDRAFTEADRLCQADETLDEDGRLLSRALLRVGVSAHRRRHGDLMGAADAARTGLGLLDDVQDTAADGGVVRPRLVLELVCALLDRGDSELALELAQPVLETPPRAAAVGPLGWLGLAVATRIHLPEGAGGAATRLLREAVHSTEQHGLHALSARLWFELAHVEEQLGRASDAIQCLHRSRAAEHVHGRARRQAYALLTGEFGAGEQAPIDLDDLLSTAPARWTAVQPQVTLPPVQREPQAPSLHVASRPQETSEPVPAVVSQPPPAREREQPARSSRQQPDTPAATTGRSTRHDSEHGSVAARSVLDRLGITAGGGAGGRRRAADSSEHSASSTGRDGGGGREEFRAGAEPAARYSDLGPERESPRTPVERTGPSGPPEWEAVESERAAAEPAVAAAEPDTNDWLPRLRLPPSLAPMDDLDFGDSAASAGSAGPADSAGSAYSSASGAGFGSTNFGGSDFGDSGFDDSGFGSGESSFERSRGSAESFDSYDSYGSSSAYGGYGSDSSYDSYDRDARETSYDPVVPAEEPPPGAGLAELLTRALAEHQAGTSSAAALVKRLGTGQGEPDTPRRVNGRHREDG